MEWNGRLLAFGISILALGAATASAANHCELYGVYPLKQQVSGYCPSVVSATPWWIDMPRIEVIDIDAGLGDEDGAKRLMGFEAPAHPAFGYPTSEGAHDHFSNYYRGGVPEYDGPTCREDAEFAQEGLRISKVCEDHTGFDCRYSPPASRGGIDAACKYFGHYALLWNESIRDCAGTVVVKPGFAEGKDFSIMTLSRNQTLMSFNAAEGKNGLFEGVDNGSGCRPSADFSRFPYMTVTVCTAHGALKCPFVF